jgi:hypothetical protein
MNVLTDLCELEGQSPSMVIPHWMLRMLPLGDCYPTLRNLAQLLAIQVLHGLLNALGATDELMQMAVIEWLNIVLNQ